MLKKTKYITYDSGLLTEMIIFADTLTHRDVAIQMRVLDNVISAGFISIGIGENDNPDVATFGESISLKVESLPEDRDIARRVLGLMQY